MKLLLLMILCHILDDFVLQGVCLVNLKQRSWWETNAPNSLYAEDYKAGLLIHSISWAIMINLPLMFWGVGDIALGISVLCNGAIHYIVDDLKANRHKINLCQYQSIHLIQIFLTWILLTIII